MIYVVSGTKVVFLPLGQKVASMTIISGHGFIDNKYCAKSSGPVEQSESSQASLIYLKLSSVVGSNDFTIKNSY